MKKFKNAHGTIYAPQSADVEQMMLNDARFTPIEDKPAAKKPARKTAARKTTAKANTAEMAETTAETAEE